MAYRYVKERPRQPLKRSIFVSFFFMVIGVGILLWAFWPIVFFRLFSEPGLLSIVTPVGGNRVTPKQPTTGDLAYAANNPGVSQTVDYTNANVWFPKRPQKRVTNTVTAYKLSIPKLKIRDALVVIGGDDLNKALIHYGGTALPGENGNGAIFGHSVLPQFFNQANYKTIFSTLPTVQVGDSIYITYDTIEYRYIVERLSVHDPDDLSVLDQPTDDAYITLVTCVPPGTYWQRLNVRAKLVRL
jgi:sortase A